MRFPMRDVVPTRTRPVLTMVTAVVCLAGYLETPSSPEWWLWLATQLVPLVVLGETVEDQLGRLRYAILLALTLLAGAGTDLTRGADLSWWLYPVAAVVGAHVGRVPASRVIVSVRLALVEVPSFVIAGTWLLAVVLRVVDGEGGASLVGPLLACLIGVAAGRWGVPAERRSWTYLDAAR